MVAYLLLSNLTNKTIFKKHIHRPSISIYFNRRAERGKLTSVKGTQGGGGPPNQNQTHFIRCKSCIKCEIVELKAVKQCSYECSERN